MSLYRRGKTWWLEYYDSDAPPTRCRVSLKTRSARAAKRAAQKILDRIDLERAGVIDPFLIAASATMESHLRAYEDSLRCCPQQRRDMLTALRRFFADRKVTTLGRLTLDAANAWLQEERKQIHVTTLNHRQSWLKQFSRWLIETGRTRYDLLRALKPFHPEAHDEENGRHRRALSSGDLTALLEVSPPDRRLVYLTAATTGLRRGELGKLQWSDLDLGGAQLRVRSCVAKSRIEAHLPLVPPVVEGLSALYERREARAELLGITEALARHKTRTAAAAELGIARSTMERRRLKLVAELEAEPGGKVFARVPTVPRLHRDLEAAGIPVDTEEGVFDFHALRTTFGTTLARAGVPLVHAQRLMRHSTPTLTARYYTRVESLDLREGVSRLWVKLWERADTNVDNLLVLGVNAARQDTVQQNPKSITTGEAGRRYTQGA